MPYLPELHYCYVCGVDLGPNSDDGICAACDDVYVTWMREHATGDLTGQCEMLTQRMIEAFPELTRMRGHVHLIGHHATGHPQGYPHWWCVTDDGDILDPTAQQFPFPLTYVPWDEAQPEPTGKCPNCGGYCFEGKYLCSEHCAIKYEAYCRNPFA